ncbi:DUF393 domain-containing protein [Alteromonas sp. a30]|nr:DUF393 domain-containing protein [Alteromonas sp. a30]
MPELTVFYDGTCPLCVSEMKSLTRQDTRNALRLIDVQKEGALSDYPFISRDAALTVLHGIDANGHLVKGLDVTYLAWKAIGKGWMIAPLRWPIVRLVADWVYVKFATHRYRISALLTGKARCEQCRLK